MLPGFQAALAAAKHVVVLTGQRAHAARLITAHAEQQRRRRTAAAADPAPRSSMLCFLAAAPPLPCCSLQVRA